MLCTKETHHATRFPHRPEQHCTMRRRAGGGGTRWSFPADAASVTGLVLDDQALSHQRGGFGGMLMVSATPQLMRGFNNSGNRVTLWAEIAPPSQLPVPVDVARSAQ